MYSSLNAFICSYFASFMDPCSSQTSGKILSPNFTILLQYLCVIKETK